MQARQFLFRLFYSTTFSLLLFVEILLLLVSPADIVLQSLENSQKKNIIALAIVYFLTLAIALFIVATRFYASHTQLAAIPRIHIPIQKGDVNVSVRKVISTGMARSAAIAYNAHPREISQGEVDVLARETAKAKPKAITWSLEHTKGWLNIEHPGWSSPSSSELPNVQFEPVLLEFPHLIEAKAVSLAPPDLSTNTETSDGAEEVLPDPRAISVLQRPMSMPLRDYLSKLKNLEMLDSSAPDIRFLSMYEQARFFGRPISEHAFRDLLADLTAILQNLRPPSAVALNLFTTTTSTSSSTPSIKSQSPRVDSLRQGLKGGAVRGKPSGAKSEPQKRKIGAKPKFQVSVGEETSQAPFLTPRPTLYQASLSSGHAGDRSSDSSLGSDSEHSVHTAWTRQGRHSRANTASRYGSTSTSAMRTPYLGTPMPRDSIDSISSEGSERAGSVIQRSMTARSEVSQMSGKSNESQGSVIWREERAQNLLPLPITIEGNDSRE